MTNEFKAKCSSVIKNGLGVEHNKEFESDLLEIHCNQTRGGFFKFKI